MRGDFASLGTRKKTMEEEGVSYDAKMNTRRFALLGDYFPFAGSFRITGGMTFNNYKLALDASGAGKVIEVGDGTYTLGPNDGLLVEVKFPSTTPYLGIGWGHQSNSGFRAAFDIGAMIGKAKVTATSRGTLSSQPGYQENLDKELAELRDGVGQVKAIPQITLSVGYSF